MLKRELCPRCQHLTLTGPDDDIAALTVTLDLTPLDRATEAQALLSARPTYTLRPGPPPGIRLRDHWTITAHPADPHDPNPVLPAHACDQPLARYRHLLHRTKEPLPEDPPY